jgi:hypothetical protein
MIFAREEIQGDKSLIVLSYYFERYREFYR